MLLRTVPSKRTGSWGIMPKRDLRSWRPSVQMSIPSMIIFPRYGSTIRNKAWINVDLPLPVLPTTPIFSPPLMLSVTPLRTKGVFSRYLTWPEQQHCTLWNMSQERLKQFIRAESRGKEKKTYCKQISKIHYAARQEQLIWYVPKR